MTDTNNFYIYENKMARFIRISSIYDQEKSGVI